MVWLILGAGFLVGIVLLVAVAMSVMNRLRPLDLAVRRSMILAEQAQGMQSKIAVLQTRIEALQQHMQAAVDRRARP